MLNNRLFTTAISADSNAPCAPGADGGWPHPMTQDNEVNDREQSLPERRYAQRWRAPAQDPCLLSVNPSTPTPASSYNWDKLLYLPVSQFPYL